MVNQELNNALADTIFCTQHARAFGRGTGYGIRSPLWDCALLVFGLDAWKHYEKLGMAARIDPTEADGIPKKNNQGRDVQRASPLAAVEVMRTTLGDSTRLGLDPLFCIEDLHGYFTQNIYAYHESFPLNIATAFMLYGDVHTQTEGRRLYAHLLDPGSRINLRLVNNTQMSYGGPISRLSSSWALPVFPEDLGVPPLPDIDKTDTLYCPAHLSWLTEEAAERMVSSIQLSSQYETVVMRYLNQRFGRRWDALLEKNARSALARYTKLQPDYVYLTHLLRCLPPADAHEWINARTQGGNKIYAVLHVTVRDSPAGFRKNGYRTLSSSSKLEIIPYIVEPLTIADVKALSPKNRTAVLYYMPWRLLEEVVTEHRSKISASLLKVGVNEATNLDWLRDCMSPHEKRYTTPHEYQSAFSGNDPAKFMHGWETMMPLVVTSYEESRKFRETFVAKYGYGTAVLLAHRYSVNLRDGADKGPINQLLDRAAIPGEVREEFLTSIPQLGTDYKFQWEF